MKTEFHSLPRKFYEPSAQAVAPALLGHWLVRRTAEGRCGGIIVETEAYLIDDPACHAAPGLTNRNRAMFGEPGHAYVYLIYGLHYCVNAVCQPAGVAEAILIRALEPVWGQKVMARRRGLDQPRQWTNGPAKLCEALQITRQQDGVDLCAPDSPLFIARNPAVEEYHQSNGPVITTTRIGINRAAHLPLRFYLASNEYVSRRIRTV